MYIGGLRCGRIAAACELETDTIRRGLLVQLVRCDRRLVSDMVPTLRTELTLGPEIPGGLAVDLVGEVDAQPLIAVGAVAAVYGDRSYYAHREILRTPRRSIMRACALRDMARA